MLGLQQCNVFLTSQLIPTHALIKLVLKQSLFI